jgi:hypothetical protein
MIKILKRGRATEQVECPECEALLQYGDIDIQHLKYLDRDKDILEVDHLVFCPQCGRGINVRAKEYIKGEKDATNTKQLSH